MFIKSVVSNCGCGRAQKLISQRDKEMPVEDRWFQMSSESVNCLPDITKTEKRSRQSRRKEKNPSCLPEKCSICTNPAVGYHYDVASCNGCKAFFRRTIISGRRHKCTSINQCLEDLEVFNKSKKLCPGCRFQKCVDLGMNPVFIQEELVSKEGKAMQREILRHRHCSKLQILASHSRDELDSVIRQLSNAEDQLHESLTADLTQQERLEYDWRSLTDILMSPSSSEIKTVAKPPFEQNQEFEVSSAHRSLLSIVEYVKLLNFFPYISIESTRQLIIQSALTCWNMTMAYCSKHFFSREDNSLLVGNAKFVKKTMHLFSRNSVDRVEYMFLKVIVLCNPVALEHPEDKVLIEQQRYQYASHLLNYCLKLHGTLNGPSRYASLLSMLTVLEMHQYEQKCYHLFLKAFHKEFALTSPLYDEILEFSSCCSGDNRVHSVL